MKSRLLSVGAQCERRLGKTEGQGSAANDASAFIHNDRCGLWRLGLLVDVESVTAGRG